MTRYVLQDHRKRSIKLKFVPQQKEYTDLPEKVCVLLTFTQHPKILSFLHDLKSYFPMVIIFRVLEKAPFKFHDCEKWRGQRHCKLGNKLEKYFPRDCHYFTFLKERLHLVLYLKYKAEPKLRWQIIFRGWLH